MPIFRKNTVRTRKEIEYKLLTAFELAREICRVKYGTEIRFCVADLTHLDFWKNPDSLHSVRRTREYGGDNLIIGNVYGRGTTMIRNPSDYIKPGYSGSLLGQIDGICEIICSYLLQYGNGAQRVAVQTVRTA